MVMVPPNPVNPQENPSRHITIFVGSLFKTCYIIYLKCLPKSHKMFNIFVQFGFKYITISKKYLCFSHCTFTFTFRAFSNECMHLATNCMHMIIHTLSILQLTLFRLGPKMFLCVSKAFHTEKESTSP